MWLRAKQRRDRWDEELQQCAADMVMITNWFTHQVDLWAQRVQLSRESNQIGYACYADKQKRMWTTFVERCRIFQPYIEQYYTARRLAV